MNGDICNIVKLGNREYIINAIIGPVYIDGTTINERTPKDLGLPTVDEVIEYITDNPDALIADYTPPEITQEQLRIFKEKSLQEETHRRVISVWPEYAQINALRGIYGEQAKAEMESFVDNHRVRYQELLSRDDFMEIDICDDRYWQWPEEVING